MSQKKIAPTRFEEILVQVSDIRRSVRFYRDKLGVPLLRTRHGDESYEADVGGVRFVLHPDFDDAVKGHPRGNGILIHLWVPDADAYAAFLRERGVSLVEPPEDRPWGRHLAVEDPEAIGSRFWRRGRRRGELQGLSGKAPFVTRYSGPLFIEGPFSVSFTRV